MGDAQYRLNPEPPSGIIPEGCTFSPDEVGAMLANRVVQPHYAAWLVRQAIEAAHAREVEALRRRAEAAEADARRYRWIRSAGEEDAFEVAGRAYNYGEDLVILQGEYLDAAIDAAIASSGEE